MAPKNLSVFLLRNLVALNLFIALAYGDCDPLIYREGIQVKCHASQDSRTPVDCHDKNSKLPVGTLARYSCEAPFYLPGNEEAADGDRTPLTCNSRGKWSGGLQKFYLFSCTLNCGVTNLASFTGFVIGGLVAKQSDWPWHATIFARARSDQPFKYICGGSLVKPYGSKGFVILTAAHCLATHLNVARNVNDVQVVLGNEESTLEGIADHSPDAQIFRVKEIVLHKSYGGQNSDFQSDIAAVRLVEPVKIKVNILPVCLSKTAALPKIGETGHIVGFGLYQKESPATSIQLRRASFPVVNPDKCFEWRSRKLLPQEYCAGTKNFQNACNGDSGGGMVFEGLDEHSKKRFYLHGLVSHGRININNDAVCDSFSVYTKVSPYIDWIYDSAEKLFGDDDGSVSEDVPPPSRLSPTTTATTQRTRPRPKPTTTTAAPDFEIPDSPGDSEVEIIGHRVPSVNGKDYEIEGMERHNYYRKMHGASDVKLSEKLNQHAQANAEKQIREKTFVNNYEAGINKNIYKFFGSRKTGTDAVQQAVDSWYADVINYNWSRPMFSTFSQVVWEGTKEIGVGFATSRNGDEQIVVVSYSPPGNVQGQFQQNVRPKI